MAAKGNPNYWQETHEPLNLELDFVVRQCWVKDPPVADLQLQFVPHYAGKHCLQSVRLSRLGNEGGAHAVAVGLLRDAVEALSVAALAISPDRERVRLLREWNENRLSAGEVRKHLEARVWPGVTITGLWEPWTEFWADLAGAVQPYAHFTPLRMRWHQRVEIIEGKSLVGSAGETVPLRLWVNHPSGDFELYRAARIVAFQLTVFWAFAEIVCAFKAGPEDRVRNLASLAHDAKLWLAKNEVFFQKEKWKVQLMPFVCLSYSNGKRLSVEVDGLRRHLLGHAGLCPKVTCPS